MGCVIFLAVSWISWISLPDQDCPFCSEFISFNMRTKGEPQSQSGGLDKDASMPQEQTGTRTPGVLRTQRARTRQQAGLAPRWRQRQQDAPGKRYKATRAPVLRANCLQTSMTDGCKRQHHACNGTDGDTKFIVRYPPNYQWTSQDGRKRTRCVHSRRAG